MKNFIILLFLMWGSFASCQNTADILEIEVDKNKTFQQIESFGASDSWRFQFVGENWPVEKREKIADLLFSLETDEKGNPKGVGLSNWRFYIGSGSTEQGDSSYIQTLWRRTECFLDKNGNYDWTKQNGQRWFLKAAKKRGVPQFTAFTISAPVFYSKNGRAFATKGDLGFNVQPDKYEAYSKFLVDVIEHFSKYEGIQFHYLSPFNEPQWAWDGNGQEGTPATNEELYRYMKILSKDLSDRKLETKLLVGEAGMIDYLYEKKGENSNGDQINVFYNPESPLYIGGFDNLEYAITGHSYFTSWPIQNQIETREKLVKRIQEINPKLGFHQTEFCILEKTDEIGGGRGRDLEMPTALYVARLIHSDLTIANSKSWDWWTALSQYNFKDGLIHLDDGKGNGVEDGLSQLNHRMRFDGNITETKLLWALGNYSRFVRPGMVRVDVKQNNNLNALQQATTLQVSAFKEPSTDKIILVFVNHQKKDIPVKLNLENYTKGEFYVTDSKRNLEKTKTNHTMPTIPAKSVSTLVLSN